jgi:hypothetical protein
MNELYIPIISVIICSIGFYFVSHYGFLSVSRKKSFSYAGIASLVIAIAFYILCNYCFSLLKKHPEAPVIISEQAESKQDSNYLDDFKVMQDCLSKHYKDDFDCKAKQKNTELKTDVTVNNKQKDQGTGNYFIPVISILLVIGLATQVFLVIYTCKLEKLKKIDRMMFYLSDWAINTPPILGVLANLISFALLLSKDGNIQDFFGSYFYEAVITTLIGGLFYIINLGLAVIIHPYIELI